jgi:hypothetical protein
LTQDKEKNGTARNRQRLTNHTALKTRDKKMVRYLVVAAGAFAMMSSLALAETTTIVRTSPTYVAPTYVAPHKTTIVKHRVNRYGQLVTVRKTHRDGFYGSSTSRVRTVTDPATGVTTKTRTTVRE